MNPFCFPLIPRMAAVAVAVVTLAGCGMFGTPSGDYYRAEPLPPIKVPEGMQTRSLEPLYSVPEISRRDDELALARGEDSFEVPRPDPLPTDGATESGVKIQKLGEERWILADAPTSQIWPRVQSFLSTYEIRVASSDPAAGRIETDWIAFKDDDKQHHRYQIWIEQGLRPDTTEVHLVHRQVPQGLTDPEQLNWTRQSDDPARESFLLDELAASLATAAKNSSASLLGQRVGGSAKSDMKFVDGEPVLQLRLVYDRAWATVAHSLGQEEFVLWESSPAKGVALIGYLTDEVRDQSFFRRLFSNDELPEQAPASLDQVLGQLVSEPQVKALFGQVPGVSYGSGADLPHTYLVVFKRAAGTEGAATSVYVRAADGRPLAPREARQILSYIRRNLI